MAKATHTELLINLSNEQTRTSESIKNINTRLFGGEGQKGIIEHLFDQSERQRQEFLKAIAKTSEDAAALVVVAKTEAETKHNSLEGRVASVEKKVWYGTGFGAAIGTGVGMLVGWFHK